MPPGSSYQRTRNGQVRLGKPGDGFCDASQDARPVPRPLTSGEVRDVALCLSDLQEAEREPKERDLTGSSATLRSGARNDDPDDRESAARRSSPQRLASASTANPSKAGPMTHPRAPEGRRQNRRWGLAPSPTSLRTATRRMLSQFQSGCLPNFRHRISFHTGVRTGQIAHGNTRGDPCSCRLADPPRLPLISHRDHPHLRST